MSIFSFNDFYLCFFLPFYILDTNKKAIQQKKHGFQTNQSKTNELSMIIDKTIIWIDHSSLSRVLFSWIAYFLISMCWASAQLTLVTYPCPKFTLKSKTESTVEYPPWSMDLSTSTGSLPTVKFAFSPDL